MHSIQCFFNISFVSCKNTRVALLDDAPCAARAAFARKKTSDSGRNILNTPANADMPEPVQVPATSNSSLTQHERC